MNTKEDNSSPKKVSLQKNLNFAGPSYFSSNLITTEQVHPDASYQPNLEDDRKNLSDLS